MLGSSIREAQQALQKGTVTAGDLVRMALRRGRQVQPRLNAVTAFCDDDALTSASVSDKRAHTSRSAGRSAAAARASKTPPPLLLDGIPVAVKDNFCVRGFPASCSSRMLKNFVPTYDATVVARTRAAGAAIIAKTNMDEFGMGCGSVDSCFGPVRNVWRSGLPYTLSSPGSALNGSTTAEKPQSAPDTSGLAADDFFVAGGSSGGSASLVASGVAFAALGSDTGGSLRIPAAWSGLVSLKPSYGRLSRHGLIPLVNSLDVPGVLARSVEDASLLYQALLSGGPIDPKDSTTHDYGFGDDFRGTSPKGLRVGIPQEYRCTEMSPEVVECWSQVVDLLDEGFVGKVSAVSLPHTELSISCYHVLNPCEVASNMARYDGLEFGLRPTSDPEAEQSTEALFAKVRHQGFNEAVRGRILIGNYFLLRQNYDKYFMQALKVRRLIADDFRRVFRDVDLLLTPVTLSEAPKYSDFSTRDNRTQTATHDYCTQPVNLAGLPAATVPVKLSGNSLPLSVQVIGNLGREDQVLSLAKWIEDRVEFPRLTLEL